MVNQQLGTNTFGVAKYIVSATSSDGTHTTIAAALTSASAGDTIFIRPGTYTENLSLKVGVNLTAFDCDATTPNVTIKGNATLTAAGTVSISGIQLETNGAALLTVSGSANSIVYLINCYLDMVNATGITFSSSGASAGIYLYQCLGNLGTTGIGIFTSTAGATSTFQFNYCTFGNTGSSTTASTTSTGAVLLQNCIFKSVFTTSSSGSFVCQNTALDCTLINTTCITTAGTGTAAIRNSQLLSGTASALSAGSGTTIQVWLSNITSSNTNAITGAGSIENIGAAFLGSSRKVNTTTQVANSGAMTGLTQGTAPGPGMIGEVISSFVTTGSPVSLTDNVTTNVTSIALTPGIWDIQGAVHLLANTVTGTTWVAAFNGLTSYGNGAATGLTFPNASTGLTIPVPILRKTLSANETNYLTIVPRFSSGTLRASGLISATRVG